MNDLEEEADVMTRKIEQKVIEQVNPEFLLQLNHYYVNILG